MRRQYPTPISPPLTPTSQYLENQFHIEMQRRPDISKEGEEDYPEYSDVEFDEACKGFRKCVLIIVCIVALIAESGEIFGMGVQLYRFFEHDYKIGSSVDTSEFTTSELEAFAEANPTWTLWAKPRINHAIYFLADLVDDQSVGTPTFIGDSGTTVMQEDNQENYEYVGVGFCRPSHCDIYSDDDCRVNGFWRDNSNENECMDACDTTHGCLGYAISNSAYDYPNRCYIYGSSSMSPEFPSRWNTYDQQNYEIAQSSGYANVQCYKTVTSNCDGFVSYADLPSTWCDSLSDWAICGVGDGIIYGSGYGCTFNALGAGYCKDPTSNNECTQFLETGRRRLSSEARSESMFTDSMNQHANLPSMSDSIAESRRQLRNREPVVLTQCRDGVTFYSGPAYFTKPGSYGSADGYIDYTGNSYAGVYAVMIIAYIGMVVTQVATIYIVAKYGDWATYWGLFQVAPEDDEDYDEELRDNWCFTFIMGKRAWALDVVIVTLFYCPLAPALNWGLFGECWALKEAGFAWENLVSIWTMMMLLLGVSHCISTCFFRIHLENHERRIEKGEIERYNEYGEVNEPEKGGAYSMFSASFKVIYFCVVVLAIISFTNGVTSKAKAVNEDPEHNIWTVIYLGGILILKFCRNEAVAADLFDLYEETEKAGLR